MERRFDSYIAKMGIIIYLIRYTYNIYIIHITKMKLIVSLSSTDNWGNAGNGKIIIKNAGENDIENWSFNFEPLNFQIGEFWNLKFSNNIISSKEWNKIIKSGQIIESGFSYKGVDELLKGKTSTDGVILNLPENPSQPIELNLPENPSQQPIELNLPENPSQQPIELNIPENPSQIIQLNHKIFGYYSEWSIYQREFNVEDIPVHQLTHVVYAFTLPNPSQEDFNKLRNNYPFPPLPYRPPPQVPEGKLVYHDEAAAKKNIQKLKKLKRDNPHIKIVISIGGWSLSWTFSKIAKDNKLRKTFIDSSIDFIIQNDFDGIDIDWEFVGKQGVGYNYVDEKNDKVNFLQMVKEFREEMDMRSPEKHLELTAATGCNPIVIANYEGTHQYLDYLLLMSYDFAGSWDNYGGHLSAIYHNPDSQMNNQFNCDAAVKNAIKAGYPTHQICLGCPLYGRGWEKIVPDNSDNSKLFGQSVSGAAKTISGAYGEPGMSSWRDIRNAIKNGTYTLYTDEISKTAYCVDANGKTWSHDTPNTVRYKVQYAKEKGLGGFLLWDLSDDTRDGQDNIIDSLIDELQKDKPIETPIEQIEPPIEIPIETPTEQIEPPEIPIEPPIETPIEIPIEPPTETQSDNLTSMHIESIPITDMNQIDKIISAIKNVLNVEKIDYLLSYSK
jgi:GH18 family chitinase